VLARWAADTRGNYFYEYNSFGTSGSKYAGSYDDGYVGGRKMPSALRVPSSLMAIWYGPGTFTISSGGVNWADTAPPIFNVSTDTAKIRVSSQLLSSTLVGVEAGLIARVSVVADNGESAGDEVEIKRIDYPETRGYNTLGEIPTFTATYRPELYNNDIEFPKSALIDIGMNYTFGGVSAGLTGTKFHFRVKLYFNDQLFDTIDSPGVHYDISL
jgi:hypothetical protein